MYVIPYDKRYREDFVQFNTAWIVEKFGASEDGDRAAFASIEEDLSQGGMIFIAVDDKQRALVVCMVKPEGGGTWEICKLGSSKVLPHKGAGTAVFEARMDWAVSHGAKRLLIMTNSCLEAAQHIYRSHGFQEIHLEDCPYKRVDLAYELPA